MLEFRPRGRETAAALPMPTTSNEEWRRTDLSGLDLSALRPAPGVVRGPTAAPALPQGVIFTSLPAAMRDHPDLVREYFMRPCVRPDESKFRALHGAFWTGGTFLSVPERVEVAGPL